MTRLFLLLVLVLAGTGADARTRERERAAEAGRFDYYVLTLSWSPAYCERRPEDRQQCGAQRHGLVLHGLWPQYAGGGYPADCAAPVPLTEDARRFGMTVFPSEKLVAHQWRKHGACTGMDPKTYFRIADEARDAIRIPPELEPGTRTRETTARDIARALRDHNPRITQRGLAVVCSGPEFSELRICLTKDLQPTACGRGVRDACRQGPVRVRGAR